MQRGRPNELSGILFLSFCYISILTAFILKNRSRNQLRAHHKSEPRFKVGFSIINGEDKNQVRGLVVTLAFNQPMQTMEPSKLLSCSVRSDRGSEFSFFARIKPFMMSRRHHASCARRHQTQTQATIFREAPGVYYADRRSSTMLSFVLE